MIDSEMPHYDGQRITFVRAAPTSAVQLRRHPGGEEGSDLLRALSSSSAKDTPKTRQGSPTPSQFGSRSVDFNPGRQLRSVFWDLLRSTFIDAESRCTTAVSRYDHLLLE